MAGSTEEETLLACAFWGVHALVYVGRLPEVRDLLRQLDTAPNALSLMSEMVDPGAYEPVGNLPQASSHLSFIQASSALRRSEGRSA